MTISDNEEIIENAEDATAKPRGINEIYDLPLSELTEEELDLLVEYKAEVKARSAVYQENVKAIQDHLKNQWDKHNELYEESKAILDKRYETVELEYQNALKAAKE